jgi:hypothetical protein
VKLRIPLLAVAIASTALLFPAPADAQIRIARPRATVVVRSPVRPRTTVFIGGFYYPSLYRASLYYGGYRGYYGGYYGASYYQWPPYYGAGFYDLSAAARLQVTPRQTEVFIDGYYAGTVDDFDGFMQRLRLEPGEHDLELYLAGYQTFAQRIYLQPGRTFTIKHVMQPLAAGQPAPIRPQGAPLPPPGTSVPGSRAPYPERRPPGPDPRDRGTDARATGFGELALRVQPADAEVLIDGERWDGGATDQRLIVQLAAGTHRLEIRKEGYRTYFSDITIRGNDTTALNVAMTKQ